jgi:DNA-binding LacI/PurR family transcriptional regulator
MSGGDRGKRRVTSFDVAERAGVSRGAVSQILNGRVARFPLATQERVLEAAADLNYKPSAAAKALHAGRSNVIFCVLPNSTFGPGMQDALDRFIEASLVTGMSFVVGIATRDPSVLREQIKQFHPVAVIDLANVLSDPERAELAENGSLVYPSHSKEYGPDGHLNIETGRVLARALLQRDRRQLVYVGLTDKREDPFSPARYEGMQLEARSRGLPPPQRLDIPLDLDGAMTAVHQIYERIGRFAAGCYNDDVAIALVAAARELEIPVPGEISVAGVDNTPLGQLIRPRLTTIDMNFDALIDLIMREITPSWRGSSGPDQINPGQMIAIIQGDST